jgi:putative ABC transport system substrate-binding protein
MATSMRRRELLFLLAGAMSATRNLRAQQRAMPVIGFLGNETPGALAGNLVAFRQGLSEGGYIDGQSVAIEYRWAESQYNRLPALAAELVGRNVDVIATSGGDSSALAAKNATSTIPIVFVAADPVGMGLVASLARPGGNLTGFSIVAGKLNPKRLDLLSELVPQAGVIALLVNPNNPNAERITRDVRGAARAKRLECHILKASTEGGIDAAFAALVQLHAGALVVGADPFFRSQGDQLVALARRDAVPAIYFGREFAAAGRPDQLWTERHPDVSPGRHLCRKDSQRRQAQRSAGPGTDDIRAGHQSEDCRGAGPHCPASDPRPRR